MLEQALGRGSVGMRFYFDGQEQGSSIRRLSPCRTRAALGHTSLVSEWTVMTFLGTSKMEVAA